MVFSRSTVDYVETEDSEADPEADVLFVAPEGLLSMVKELPVEGDNGGVDRPWMKNVRRGTITMAMNDHDGQDLPKNRIMCFRNRYSSAL